MENYYFFAIVLSIILLIGFVANYFSEKSMVKRALKKAKFRRLGSLKHGEIVRTAGQVEFIDEPLTAPLTSKKCAYYKVLVEREGSGEDSSWTEYISEEKFQNFYISNATTKVLVNTKVVLSHLVMDARFDSGFLNDPGKHLEEYLESHGKSATNLIGLNKKLRYSEATLVEGEMVAVAGKVEALSSISNRGDTLFQITHYDDKEVVITDDSTLLDN